MCKHTKQIQSTFVWLPCELVSLVKDQQRKTSHGAVLWGGWAQDHPIIMTNPAVVNCGSDMVRGKLFKTAFCYSWKTRRRKTELPDQRLLSAGNPPTATGAASLESLNSCLHTTNSSIRACRITTSCQADLTQVPGWREGVGEQSVRPPAPTPTPTQHGLLVRTEHRTPHTPFSPSESPWQEEQSSLVLKVSSLSSLLTADQLQEYRQRNEEL